MNEEQNGKVNNVYERIETLYFNLAFFNLKYHRLIRDLGKLKKEMGECRRELVLLKKLKEVNPECIAHETDIELLTEAYLALDAGSNELNSVIGQMKSYITNVDGLIDVSDEVARCIDALNELDILNYMQE